MSGGISRRRRDGLNKVTLEDLDGGSKTLAIFLFAPLLSETSAILNLKLLNQFSFSKLTSGVRRKSRLGIKVNPVRYCTDLYQ